MRIFSTLWIIFLASFIAGCQSPHPSQVTFHRSLPDVITAIQQFCAPIQAQSQQPGAKWVAGTNSVPSVSYTVYIQDQFTSYPIGRTEISAVSISPAETQLRVISLKPTSLRWVARPEVESQTVAEISQILGR